MKKTRHRRTSDTSKPVAPRLHRSLDEVLRGILQAQLDQCQDGRDFSNDDMRFFIATLVDELEKFV